MKQNDSETIKRIDLSKDIVSRIPIIQSDNEKPCNFQGYDGDLLMKETVQLRKLITKR